MLRMEVARLFGQWPHDLLAVPLSEYRRLIDYYQAVKEADDPEEPSEESED